MFQKTESSEFASGFLWHVMLITAIVFGLILFSGKLFKSPQREAVSTPSIVVFPWTLAGAHTIENGLLAFSGKPPQPLNGKNQVRALAGMLVVAVIFPTIYLLRWRRRRVLPATSHEPTPWRIPDVFHGLCGVFVLLLAVAILPIGVYNEIVQENLREAQAVQSNRDEIINESNFIAFSLSQYYILPNEYEGGNHSYEGYRLPENASKTADATYVVTPYGQTAGIHAQSVRYPSCWIDVRVDSLGRMGQWRYGGQFQ
jgi:hypothetical protein